MKVRRARALFLCAFWIPLAVVGACSRLRSSARAAFIQPECLKAGETRSQIKHVVVIIQENHSFDSYFANYCKAPPGSNPTCTQGPECCETGPRQVSNQNPIVLTDQENLSSDRGHSRACQIEEMNGGKMDRFVTGAFCSNPKNFAYADSATAGAYWKYAAENSIADRYFQPSAGASAQNNMYFARASFVFEDNSVVPDSAGRNCYLPHQRMTYEDQTLGDLLASCEVPWSFYAEGYDFVLKQPDKCLSYPNYYDASDNPFQYYKNFQDNPSNQKDYSQLKKDISAGSLPAVTFVKALGTRSEHPAFSKITDGANFVSEIFNLIVDSPRYGENTLLLVVSDESGGFYDHVPPPQTSSVDNQPYGPRVPLFALGYFSRKNTISHVTMEHSSIVRFIEWNFLAGTPGQLGLRDAKVNGIGSLLDPDKTGTRVPE